MKKKIKNRAITIIVAITALIILIMGVMFFTGCSYNQSIMDMDYGFETALVLEKGEWVEYQVKKWDDYENDMVCIWTKDGKVIYSSSNNIIWKRLKI